MIIRNLAFGFTSATPATATPGIVLAPPSSAHYDGEEAVFTLHGACRIPIADIEVERIELLRGIVLTSIAAPWQGAVATTLAGKALLHDDDVVDLANDAIGAFQCDVVLARRSGAYYLHAAYRQHVSNIVRIEAA